MANAMANRWLQDADDLVLPAVAETVEKLPDDPRYAAAIRLAKRYAAQIDAAHQSALDAEKAWDLLDLEDMTGRRLLYKIETKVQAQSVLAELGPKLLSVLESLGVTPQAESKITKGGAKDEQQSPGLSRMREARSA